MRLSARQIDILRYLNDCGDTNVQRLADLVDVTAQTLRTELTALTGLLEGTGVSLSLLPGNVVHIDGAENLPAVLMEADGSGCLAPDEQIELYLLVDGGFVIMQRLADDLHTSRSYTEKHVAALRRDGSFPIRAERRLGIRFDGTPYQRVKRFMELMLPHVPGVDFLEELSRVETDGVPVLHGLSRHRVEASERLAQMLRQDRNESLTDDSYRRILLAALFLQSDGAPGSEPAAPQAPEALAGPLTQLATLPEAAQYRRRIEDACASAGIRFTASQTASCARVSPCISTPPPSGATPSTWCSSPTRSRRSATSTRSASRWRP